MATGLTGPRSSPASTASQYRGDDKTHSIALQLQRARQMMNSLEATPDSTKYKNQRRKVSSLISRAEEHLSDDKVSASYEDFLAEEMGRSEEACAKKDDEFDVAQHRKRKVERDKEDLISTLPRGLGTRFSGEAADYAGFRHYFVKINETCSPPLAIAHMMALVDPKTREGRKLRRRMKIYTSGKEALKDMDKDFNCSFLNAQTIINKISCLKGATSMDEEMQLIIKFRNAKRSLDLNGDHQQLLHISQLIQWSDKLLPATCKDLLKIIQEFRFGERGPVVERYFFHIEQIYEMNSILLRNRDSREPPARVRGRGFESDQRSFEVQTEGGASSGNGTRDTRVADEHSTIDGDEEGQDEGDSVDESQDDGDSVNESHDDGDSVDESQDDGSSVDENHDEGDSGNGCASEDRDEILSLESGWMVKVAQMKKEHLPSQRGQRQLDSMPNLQQPGSAQNVTT